MLSFHAPSCRLFSACCWPIISFVFFSGVTGLPVKRKEGTLASSLPLQQTIVWGLFPSTSHLFMGFLRFQVVWLSVLFLLVSAFIMFCQDWGLEPPRTGLCGVLVASLHCVHLADSSELCCDVCLINWNVLFLTATLTPLRSMIGLFCCNSY